MSSEAIGESKRGKAVAAPRMAGSNGNRAGTTLYYVLAALLAAVFLIPLIWMVSTSLRPVGLAPATRFEWFPPALALDNYSLIFQITEMGSYIRNSLLVMGTAVPLTLITSSLAGFAITQLPTRVQGPFNIFLLTAWLVPKMALWLTVFQVYKWLGIINTPLALIAPAVMGTSPLFVLLFAAAFRRVPAEIFDQARVDGAGAWRIWWSIGLPLVRPVALAVIVLATEFYWSDFVGPLLYVADPSYYTMPMGLQLLRQMDKTNWPLLMAGSVLLSLPVLVTFLMAQRFLFSAERGQGWLGR